MQYTNDSALVKRLSFSPAFWARLMKFSSWACPMLVNTPMVGRMTSCSGIISSGSEMPASKMAKLSASFICHTESGTPTCEL